MCACEWLVIARVAKMEAYFEKQPNDGPVFLLTRVTVVTEAIAHGAVPSTFSFPILGGNIPGWGAMIVAGERPPHVGERYLLFIKTGLRPSTVGESPEADLVMWFRLPAQMRLPGHDEMAAIWGEHCSTSESEVHPSEKYFSLLPKSLLDRVLDACEHY